MNKFPLKKSKLFRAEKHGFHLVRPSPWPFLTAISLLLIAIHTVLIFHEFETEVWELPLYLLYFLSIIGMWFRDIIIESTYQGFHTSFVQRGLRYGMIVFLLSETMFFFGFFWCFFLHVYFTFNLNWMYLTTRRNWTGKSIIIASFKHNIISFFRN